MGCIQRVPQAEREGKGVGVILWVPLSRGPIVFSQTRRGIDILMGFPPELGPLTARPCPAPIPPCPATQNTNENTMPGSTVDDREPGLGLVMGFVVDGLGVCRR